MTAKILIVEDEPLLAMALSEHLSGEGYEIAGIAPTVSKGLTMLDQKSVDAAILDCNLRGESVEPLAAALRERGIPFLFQTGHSSTHLSQQFRDTPLLPKPVAADVLLKAVRALVEDAG